MTTQPRFNIYAFIHKGIRLAMSQSLIALGRMDPEDDAELDPVMAEVARLLRLCRDHVKHENNFIHPAMELRQPGSARTIAGEHVSHLEEIDTLEQELQRILRLPSLRRAESTARFYHHFAAFMQENFEHMAKEETDNNAVLWACYSDEELIALEQELVASIEPAMMEMCLEYMVSAMNPVERAGFVGGLRQAMPEDVFNGVFALIEQLLLPGHRIKLRQALDLPTLNAA